MSVAKVPPKVILLDTTLRDGMQTRGIKEPTLEERVTIARALKRIGVDIIEAGSAIRGKDEQKVIKAICDAVGPDVSSFARMRYEDIDAVYETGARGIELVFPASRRHMKYKLRLTEAEVIENLMASVDYAQKKGLKIEVLAEDGTNANPEFLKMIMLKLYGAGVDGFCVCDTLGCSTPEEIYKLFKFLRDDLKEDYLNNKTLGFHGHNDTGLVVANNLAALRANANTFHVTVNGLGERAGNCPLEELAADLWLFYRIKTIKLNQIWELSMLVAKITNLYPGWNKPFVGWNVFAHESGIHVDGLLKNRKTYEFVSPGLVGREITVALGRLSGRASIKYKLKELGIELEEERIPTLLKRVHERSELERGGVSDADFLMLVEEVKGNKLHEKIKIEKISVITGNTQEPHAQVEIRFNSDKNLYTGSAFGNGPVDAAYKAIDNALRDHGAELTDYHVDAIKGGSDAPVRVKICVKKGNKKITSSALGDDIIMASVNAYIKALNILL